MRELNDAEAAIAKVLDGADESDADVAGDAEPEPDAPLRPGEDGSVASLEIAAPDDDDSDDDDSPADASPGCLAGVPIATNNATAGLAAPHLHQHLHLPCLHAWLSCSSLKPCRKYCSRGYKQTSKE